MEQKSRVVVIRDKNGNDHVRHFPVFHYESVREAIDAHGEEVVLGWINRVAEEQAKANERAALAWDIAHPKNLPTAR